MITDESQDDTIFIMISMKTSSKDDVIQKTFDNISDWSIFFGRNRLTRTRIRWITTLQNTSNSRTTRPQVIGKTYWLRVKIRGPYCFSFRDTRHTDDRQQILLFVQTTSFFYQTLHRDDDDTEDAVQQCRRQSPVPYVSFFDKILFFSNIEIRYFIWQEKITHQFMKKYEFDDYILAFITEVDGKKYTESEFEEEFEENYMTGYDLTISEKTVRIKCDKK